MGGRSSSQMKLASPEQDDFSGAKFEGELVVEGGGFAGFRTGPSLDESMVNAFRGQDGMYLRIRSSNGASLKVRICV